MKRKNASLLYASSVGELSFIRRLFKDGVDINTKDKDGNTALHEAARANQVEALQLLLENEADINAINNLGNSALHVAILANSFECFECLLLNGIKINRFNNNKKSELMCALQLAVDKTLEEKKEKIIELLIGNGNIDLKAKTGDSVTMFKGSNYLFEAIECGNSFAVAKLVEKDITLCETKNKDGNYPIHFAVAYDHLDITRLLISKNKKYMDIRGQQNLAPIHVAVFNACYGMVEYFIEQNADVNVLSNDAITPLHVATLMYSECCMNNETVCEHTSSLQTVSNFHDNVVTLRKKCAFLVIAAYLIEKGGANIYLKNEEGKTALDSIETEKDIVKTLKMMYLHKPLNDKINSLTNEVRSLRMENNDLREKVTKLEAEI